MFYGLRLSIVAASVWTVGPVSSEASEAWGALSTTASAITGNVTFSPGRITFQNGKHLDLIQVGTIPLFQVYGNKVRGELYKVLKPDDPVLLRGNRLCGGSNPTKVTFLVAWKFGTASALADRGIATFSGDEVPTNDNNTCSTFSYVVKPASVLMPADRPRGR